ncbi:MAG: glycosyltransferase family 9 protein [Oscillochloris sp.]|nr:glycosyltransferase family 9 protein [Oscillochloris sp.]
MKATDATTPGLLQRIPPPQRVVIVKASRIGDFICATPALRALRQALPAAEITLVTLPMLRDLAARLPDIDHVAEFPGYPGIAEQLFDPRTAHSFFCEMQAVYFDLALQIQGSGVHANPFTLMLGAQHSAGFIRPDDPPGLLAAALPLPDSGHEVQRMLDLPLFLGASAAGHGCAFPLRPGDHAAAADLLASAQAPLIGLHPGARDANRRWPADRFSAVARHLHQHFGASVVLIGEPDDPALHTLHANLHDIPHLRGRAPEFADPWRADRSS